MEQKDIDNLQKAFVDFKAVNEQALAEIKLYGTAMGETKSKLEKIETRLDAMVEDVEKREKAREAAAEVGIKAIDTRLGTIEALVAKKSPHFTGREEKDALAQQRRDVFFKALKSGKRSDELQGVLTPDEIKVLQIGSDTAGGYLAPPEYIAEILKDVVQFSPIRSISRVRSTSKPEVMIPRRTQTATAAWVSELGTRSETTNPAFGLEKIPTHEMYAMTKVSKQDLEDSAFDLQGFLQAEFSEQFGLTEGTALVSGTGLGQPEGFMTAAAVTSVNTGDANLLTPDGLIELYYELKEQYLPNAMFVLSRSSLKAIRKMKDGEGNYLWAPGIKADAKPATLLGSGYITAPDMPTVAANAYPIAFGDFMKAFMVIDRIEMEMMVDPFTSKSSGMVEFSARRRVGGQVVIAEAIKKLKVAA